MKTHWTARNRKALLYKVIDDFIIQLEKKMEASHLSQDWLAKRLKISKGRVSQVLGNPGNISLRTVIKFARSLDMKVALIAYDDSDPKNHRGPISPEVFVECWEKCNKPKDLWVQEPLRENRAFPVLSNAMDQCWDLPRSNVADWGINVCEASAVPDPDLLYKENEAAVSPLKA